MGFLIRLGLEALLSLIKSGLALIEQPFGDDEWDTTSGSDTIDENADCA